MSDTSRDTLVVLGPWTPAGHTLSARTLAGRERRVLDGADAAVPIESRVAEVMARARKMSAAVAVAR
jgi:hypothetical protein